MIWKLRIGKWRITFTFAPVTDVIGVNSNLDGDDHILMWDFDDTSLKDVVDELLRVQRIYELPKIYILETKKDTNYMAYCFKRTPWRKVVEIIAFTKGVDWNYLKYGVYRNRFTLRVTPKCERLIRLCLTLPSAVPEDCSIPDLKSWVKYETLADKRL
jgi:hypothetical protein